MTQETPTVQSSQAQDWCLKDIKFAGRNLKIITQNHNGPCSFLAICNILILRGNITIQSTRTTVSYMFLSQLIAEYLLNAYPGTDVSPPLSILPSTQKGLDLNPLFTSPTSFRPAGNGGSLQLFAQLHIPLVHGWLVDPSSPEYPVLKRVGDYDSAVMLIAEVDHLARGKFVVDDNAIPDTRSESTGVRRTWTKEERAKIEDAVVVKPFLDSTSGQMTYHGLFHLAATLKPGSLVALFVNSHVSVLYKSRDSQESALYTLATDQVFLNESSIVWERLEDIDGGSSTFVDAKFVKSVPVGGDWAGDTVIGVLKRTEVVHVGEVDMVVHALARELQAEEQKQQDQRRRRKAILAEQKRLLEKSEKEKKEKMERKKLKGDHVTM
ncbi:hypothetical protein B0H34DRAFT_668018 [Crassisporium funariophilum]|nr:hypothetical protein B0H34DRAFT_668018 [Crassisporium funariophilum]